MRYVLLTLLALVCQPVAADPSRQERQARLDKIVAEAVKTQNLPGVAVEVDIPGQGTFISTGGYGNLATHAARDSVQPFRIASITKTMTATVILLLIEEGKLHYDDVISKWYPNFPNADKITIDDLLRMRSGMPDAADAKFLTYYSANPLMKVTAEDMIARTAALRDQFKAPDVKSIYNNVNYMMLERVACKVTGKQMSELFAERLFKPLKMKDSYYPVGTDPQLRGSLHGYVLEDGQMVDKTAVNTEPAGGAGAVVSSLQDLSVWVRALSHGALLRGETQARRLRIENINGQPEWVGYGEGIEKLGKFLGHNGTIIGFSTECYYLPEKDATLVINVNRLDADDHSQSAQLFADVTRAMFPDSVNW